MAAKEITTVYFSQQVPYPLTASDVFGEAFGMQLRVPVFLSSDYWPRIMPCGSSADAVAILSGGPVQPIAQA